MAQSVCEIMRLHQLSMKVGIKTLVLTKLWCNNQHVIHIASNPVFHKRIKHIEIDCHFVRKKIQLSLISTRFVKTGEQLGDIFTKFLSGDWISYLQLEGEPYSIYLFTYRLSIVRKLVL